MEKKYKIGMDVAIAVTALGFFANLISITFSKSSILLPLVYVLLFILVGYYAVWGYKKPHGNMLRYIMLIYAFSHLSIFFSGITLNQKMLVIRVVIMCLTTYVAGRLNKIHKNKYIMVLILLLNVYIGSRDINLINSMTSATMPIALRLVIFCMFLSRVFLWIAICSAYFTRFLQHKEAGLED